MSISSKHPEVYRFTITWISMPGCCSRCTSLNGNVYEDQSIFDPYLVDPVYGPVWDWVLDQSLVHPNCKCDVHIDVEVDLDKWQELNDLREKMESVDLI